MEVAGDVSVEADIGILRVSAHKARAKIGLRFIVGHDGRLIAADIVKAEAERIDPLRRDDVRFGNRGVPVAVGDQGRKSRHGEWHLVAIPVRFSLAACAVHPGTVGLVRLVAEAG